MPARPLSGLGAGVGGGEVDVERGTPTCERDLGGAGSGWARGGCDTWSVISQGEVRSQSSSPPLAKNKKKFTADGARGPRRGEASSPSCSSHDGLVIEGVNEGLEGVKETRRLKFESKKDIVISVKSTHGIDTSLQA